MSTDFNLPTTRFEKMKSVAELLGDRYTPEMRAAFPDVECPFGKPFGFLVCVQLRQPKKKIGSILMADESKDAERYRVQAALVRSVGNAAFHDRQTGVEWKEGAWFKEGDFIRCPIYGGDRVSVDFGTGDDQVVFVYIREVDAIAPVTGDVLQIKTS